MNIIVKKKCLQMIKILSLLKIVLSLFVKRPYKGHVHMFVILWGPQGRLVFVLIVLPSINKDFISIINRSA